MRSHNRSPITRAARIVSTIVIVAAVVSPSFADAPELMTYQGRLADNSPLQDPIDAPGGLPMRFSIWDSQIGGLMVWGPEDHPVIPVVNGIFNVMLGQYVGITPDVFDDDARWLEIEIDGEVLTPRQRIGMVAYAGVAGIALEALELDCSDCVSAGAVEFSYAGSSSKGGPADDLSCASCVSSGEVNFNYAGSASQGGPADNLACSNCVSDGEVQFNYAASSSEAGPANSALDLSCSNCVNAGEVQFNYAGSSSEGGDASGLSCSNCVSSSEIVDGQIVNADISSIANIAPSKISGTAWTSTNDGAGSGLDADLLDGLGPGSFPRIRDSGFIFSPATSHTLVLPHYRPWTLQLSSGWPHVGGMAMVMGFENDNYIGITYTKYNGDGTSTAGGAECHQSTTNTILTFGSGGHTYTLKCPGETSGDENLVLTRVGGAVEVYYKLIY